MEGLKKGYSETFGDERYVCFPIVVIYHRYIIYEAI
jgi:hypothetical protein